ncbi:MAG: hypothetical protein ACO3E8_07260 [Candidatus Methylacidiphilales bacterium]
MRISLPPRPAAAGGAKPASSTVAIPAASKPPLPGAGAPAPKPGTPAAAAPRAGAPMGAKPATVAPGAVRTVVDTDSSGTALAVAALIASLISFGVVLMSFLQK